MDIGMWQEEVEGSSDEERRIGEERATIIAFISAFQSLMAA